MRHPPSTIIPGGPRLRRAWDRLDPGTRFAGLAGAGLGVLALLAGALFDGATTVAGGIAALIYSAAVVVVWRFLRHRYPHAVLGYCNALTLLRLVLASVLVIPLLSPAGGGWAVFGLASVALALDGVDGWLARREGLVSAFGARFDMEVDAGLALVLALNAWASGSAGGLVLILGMPRYLLALTGLGLPWLAGDLPERFSRKAVCVLQIGVLVIVQLPVVGTSPAQLLVGLAALALAWSFGRDIYWLWRRHA